MKKERKTVCVVAKVSPEARKRLDKVRERYGFRSSYEIMQYLLSAFLRVADPEGETGPGDDAEKLAELAELFEGFDSCRTRFNTSAPSTVVARKLRSLVAVFDIAGRRRRDVLRVRLTDGGGTSSEAGTDKSLSGLLRDIAPAVWKDLVEAQTLAGKPAALTLAQALRESLDRWREVANARDVNEEFTALADHDAALYGERTRRKPHKSPDDL